MKPGVIGWAQINYPHGSSIEDARHKLEYDFYYFKNRNLSFDLIIALKAWRIPFEIPTH
jgi:lipopolysaccharide/colanic/teichoic acid biosynthesis glycosyltransferase